MRLQIDYVAFFIDSGLIGDFSLENQIKLSLHMLVKRKRGRVGIFRDAVKNQFFGIFARQPRHEQSIGKVLPRKPVQLLHVEVDSDKSAQGVPQDAHTRFEL